jgi:hypothetical protein
VRIRAVLAESGYPVQSKDIRKKVDVTSAVLYQTLRRMVERGEIVKTGVPAQGGNAAQGIMPTPAMVGYVLVGGDEAVTVDMPGAGVAEVHAALSDLTGYIDGVGTLARASAIRFLERRGIESELAEVLVESAVTTGQLRSGPDDHLSVP